MSLRFPSHASLPAFAFLALVLAAIAGCGPPLPPSKPISQLTPQEAHGYQVFQSACARCHYAYREHGLKGPGLQHLYTEKFLPSGAPANDERVTHVIQHGRAMMPAFDNKLDEQQLQDLLAYLHTL